MARVPKDDAALDLERGLDRNKPMESVRFGAREVAGIERHRPSKHQATKRKPKRRKKAT